MRTYSMPAEHYWRDIPEPLKAAVDKAILPWEGTPYVPGQRCVGAGVDCVRFVCSVLDRLRGEPRSEQIPNLPQDTSLHDRRGALACMRLIRVLYQPNFPVCDGSLEPGDVVVTGPNDGGPGHALIVGARKNELWHATHLRVMRTGLGYIRRVGDHIFATYRMEGRSTWAKHSHS